MSDKNVHDQVETNDFLIKAQGFWAKSQKQIITGFIAIVVIVGGWFAYQNFILKPKELKAQEVIFQAQQYFQQDSLKLALNGDGINKGFLYIISNYGGTSVGNLAKYYAGLSYLKSGEFANAVKYLKDFSTDAKQIQMMAYGALGDAYSELKNNNEAIDSYKKAATTLEKDEVNASEYLFRAALLSELSGKTKEAVELYKQLKDKFPATEKGLQADKYIYRLNIEPNDLSVK